MARVKVATSCGEDQIAEPQAWKQQLAEAARVEDALILIETFQRWQWAADITERTVVIVLDRATRQSCGR
jgi:hypothetical protein